MTETQWLDPAEERAWRGYRRMFLLLNARLARDLTSDSGLSEPDYDVLSTLSEAGGGQARLSALAERMLWSQSRLSHHIARMQGRGLVTRGEVESDGRGSVVVLTLAGTSALEAAAPGHVAAVRAHLIDRLSTQQIAMLGDIAETVVSGLSEATASG
ncbi:MAG: MarR family transcriptional regulator [Pseudonocardiales bacterium]|nr:MAG: MarR family transcriptional regulator [Pseudonocardiales bacterium]